MSTSSDILQGLSSSIFDNEAKFARERSFGKKLLITAWAVEIMAASIGLIIAFTMAYDAYNNSEVKNVNTTINALLGALPFLLIAVIEPTKIPLASGLYKVKNWGWKTLILLALLGLTAVTFETLFTGLERQVTNVTAVISKGENEIQNLEEEIEQIELWLENNESIDIGEKTLDLDRQISESRDALKGEQSEAEADYQNRKALLEEKKLQAQAELVEIEAQRNESKKQVLSALQSELQSFNDKITEKTEEKRRIEQNMTGARNGASKDEIVLNYELQIGELQQKIDQVSAWLTSREEPQIKKAQNTIGVTDDGKAGPNTSRNFEVWRAAQENRINEIRVSIQDRLTELNSIIEDSILDQQKNINRLAAEIIALENQRGAAETQLKEARISASESLPPTKAEVTLQNELQNIDDDIEELKENYRNSLDEIKEKREAEQAELEAAKTKIINDNLEIKDQIPLRNEDKDSKEKQVNDKRQDLRLEAQKNQIYRFAQKLRGYDDILSVTEKDLTFVATIWFGSIALVCATVGTILALISNIMTDPDAFVEKERRRRNNRLARSLRRLSLAFRKRLLMKRKIVTVEVPTEVEKIVEVEKVVEKIVEKPIREEVDKLVPEIVPIPIFVPHGGDPQAELDKVTGHYDALNKRVQETFEKTARKHEDYDESK